MSGLSRVARIAVGETEVPFFVPPKLDVQLNQIPRSGRLTKGPNLETLIREVKRIHNLEVIPTSSGTLALIIAMLALKKQWPTAKKLIIADYTWDSVALAAEVAGFQIVRAPPCPEHFTPLLNDIVALDNEEYLFCSSDVFNAAVEDCTHNKPPANLQVAEVMIDAAHSFGGDQTKERPDTLQAISLSATKLITAGEGGFIAGKSGTPAVHTTSQLARYMGRMPETSAKVCLASIYRGYESRKERREVYEYYATRFKNADLGIIPQQFNHDKSSFFASAFKLPCSAEEVAMHCSRRGIEMRQYYFNTVQTMAGVKLANRTICLPTYLNAPTKRIADVVIDSIRKVRA